MRPIQKGAERVLCVLFVCALPQLAMTSETSLQNSQLTPGRVKAALRAHGWTWKSCGAAFGLIGGLIAPVIGLALTALAWFITEWHGMPLKSTGAILFFLTIPLLIFGAHCLDLIDKEVHKTRLAKVEKNYEESS